MIAVDTNIVVRFLVDDGSAEVPRVVQFVRENSIAVHPTVLLETEWVLRYTVGLKRSEVIAAFERLLGLRAAAIGEREAVLTALDAYRDGCDFADALHWALTRNAEAFATLDKKFARRAGRLGLTPPIKLVA
jgi:predicted nucleic-acid-binding protein